MTDDEMLAWVCAQTSATHARRGERIQQLWSGYGELVRVHVVGRRSSPQSGSVVVKHVRPKALRRGTRSVDARGHARKLRSYEVEQRWYQQYAERCGTGCRVPRLLGARSRGSDRLMLLEDLDQSGFAGRRRCMSGDDLAAGLSWLAHLHATFLGVRPDGLWAEGTYWHLATRPDELDAMPRSLLKACAPALDRALRGARFRTLVHGDAKVANLCFGPSGVAAVDFQYVGGGCGMRDVAYLLSCMPAGWCDVGADDALDHYFDVLRGAVAPGVNGVALEAEWRALYPVAWADFARFLAGWSTGGWQDGGYGDRLVAQALAAVGR